MCTPVPGVEEGGGRVVPRPIAATLTHTQTDSKPAMEQGGQDGEERAQGSHPLRVELGGHQM